MNTYSIKDLQKDFPNDEACLEYIFRHKYPKLKGYYKIKSRKSYADAQGWQIHPLERTIFEKSSTSLKLWFYAIFLFASSKNGVSAKELQRQLGVTYKCAWRIANQIRSLMKQGGDLLSGVVEVDETYFGGRKRAGKDNVNLSQAMENKSVIAGAVERKGNIRAKIAPNARAKTLGKFLKENIEFDSHLITDDSTRYYKITRPYTREAVNHSREEYVRGNAHTNTIEGFWSQLKRSVKGTYHSVSKKHLQSYVDEFAFRYNWRISSVPVFEVLISRICR